MDEPTAQQHQVGKAALGDNNSKLMAGNHSTHKAPGRRWLYFGCALCIQAKYRPCQCDLPIKDVVVVPQVHLVQHNTQWLGMQEDISFCLQLPAAPAPFGKGTWQAQVPALALYSQRIIWVMR